MATEAAVPASEEDRVAAGRLEAALERIARGAERAAQVTSEPDPRLGQVAARIEALIATLQNALGTRAEE